MPLSGAPRGRWSGDATVELLGRDRTIECKARKDGFRELYAWLEGRDLLVVRADRRDALVVLPLKLAAEIAMAAQNSAPPGAG
jgi:hypothetical protein